MVPPSNKRKLPSSTEPAPKRSKNQPPKASKPQPKKPQQKKTQPNKTDKKKNSSLRTVDGAALSWQTVGEEDFGGLQVIEGVDVVRQGGSVRFLVASAAAAEAKAKKLAPVVAAEEKVEDDEFEGFGDDVVEGEDVGGGEAGDTENGLEGEENQEKAESKDQKAGEKKEASAKDDKKAKVNKKTDKEADQNPDKKKSDYKTDKKTDPKKKTAPPKDDKLAATEEVLQESAPSSKGNAFDVLAAAADLEEDEVDMAAWVALNLSSKMLAAIAKLKFPQPTMIQEKAIPEIMDGEDVVGKAQTGSGKTLAFGIPMVEKWLDMYEGDHPVKKTGPMAVVLSPTRELAKQLGDHLKALCEGLPTAPYVVVVTGGLSIHKQQRQLEKADIVIGTPGRLWEVLDGDMKLQDSFAKIRFLVVDEADRLFKQGQFKEAEDIIGALDKKGSEADNQKEDEDSDEEEEDTPPRQTLVFSATFDKNLQTKLAGNGKARITAGSDVEKMAYLMKCLKFRSEPKFIDVDPTSKMATGLKEGLIECGAMEKDLYLYTILLLNPGRRTLVFTNSISAVRRLTPLLANLNLAALPLHSQMAQKARLRSLERFTAARNSILIATDVAARGLDIKEVDQVLHYHRSSPRGVSLARSMPSAPPSGST
ncbi:hypothetical protein G7046_g6617 [Stylonectria norvegica]|nr:hypothetical protein G7046_g6617 [Stylonectria norvegica]